jgi:hypothetical protein
MDSIMKWQVKFRAYISELNIPRDDYRGIMEYIDEVPVQPEQRWTPCDKGEPDEDMECWVTVKTTDVLYRGNFTKRYGERRDKGFITSGGFMWWNTALAWMPIYEPEPYRTEGDDDHEG